MAVGSWEARASTWFNDTWTGERGNYTNATAGYVGNNLSSGIESNWRYTRRDVVGYAGNTKRISLEVFTPSLLQYLSIRSKKHADKILCPKTGAHIFPSEATYIPSKLWKKFPDFKVHSLLLSYCEALQHVRKIWAEDMEFFHGLEFFHGYGKGESFGEAITRFRASGLKMKLARSATVGILIPTKSMMQHLDLQKFPSFELAVQCVEDCRVMYECMYHRDGNFDADYGDMSVEDKLEIMESFVRVTPMPIKSGERVFLCNCGNAYRNYGCVHSGVVSMLWNPGMTFRDVERAHQLKAKQTKKASNPFDAVAKRNKKEKIAQPLAKDDPKIIWKPVLPAYSAPLEDSGASMAAKSRSMGRAQHQAQMNFL